MNKDELIKKKHSSFILFMSEKKMNDKKLVCLVRQTTARWLYIYIKTKK